MSNKFAQNVEKMNRIMWRTKMSIALKKNNFNWVTTLETSKVIPLVAWSKSRLDLYHSEFPCHSHSYVFWHQYTNFILFNFDSDTRHKPQLHHSGLPVNAKAKCKKEKLEMKRLKIRWNFFWHFYTMNRDGTEEKIV